MDYMALNADGVVSRHAPDGRPYAASIARKSDPNQAGLAAQHIANSILADREGAVIPDHPLFRYEDDDTTGKALRRTDLDRFISVVTGRGGPPFTRAYATERERVARWEDPRRLMAFELLCLDHGVLIRYGDEEPPATTDGALEDITGIGQFLGAAVKNCFTSAERRKIRRRMTRGKRLRVIQGFYPGSDAPYGMVRVLVSLTTGEVVERIAPGATVSRDGCGYKLDWADDAAKARIRYVYDLYEELGSARGVARRLNREKVPAPSSRPSGRAYTGKTAPRWTWSTVRFLLLNPIYCGRLVWGRTAELPKVRGDRPEQRPVPAERADPNGSEPIVVEHFVADPPITREQWARVERTLRSRERYGGRSRTEGTFLLTGAVRCAQCGLGFHGHATVPPQKRYLYYTHFQPGEAPDRVHDCPHIKRRVRAEPLNDAALNITRSVLTSDVVREAVAAEFERKRTQIGASATRNDIRRIEQEARSHDRAADQASENAMRATSESARRRHEALCESESALADQARARLRAAEARLERVARAEAVLLQMPTATLLQATFDAMTRAEQKQLILAVIRQATVDLTKGTVTYEVIVGPDAPSPRHGARDRNAA